MKWYSAVVLHSQYYLQGGRRRRRSILPFCPRPCIARAKPGSSLKPRIGPRFAPLTAMPTCRRCAAEFPSVARTICADFPSGSIFAATPASCCREAKALSAAARVARRSRSRRPGSETSAMVRRPQSFRRQRHVRRGLRLDAALQRSLRPNGRARFPSASKPKASPTLPTGPPRFAGPTKRSGPSPWANGSG